MSKRSDDTEAERRCRGRETMPRRSDDAEEERRCLCRQESHSFVTQTNSEIEKLAVNPNFMNKNVTNYVILLNYL